MGDSTDKKTISVRVPPDTYERFEEFREDRGLSKTDAGRRLFDSALGGGLATIESGDDSQSSERSREPDPILRLARWGGPASTALTALVLVSMLTGVATVLAPSVLVPAFLSATQVCLAGASLMLAFLLTANVQIARARKYQSDVPYRTQVLQVGSLYRHYLDEATPDGDTRDAGEVVA